MGVKIILNDQSAKNMSCKFSFFKVFKVKVLTLSTYALGWF